MEVNKENITKLNKTKIPIPLSPLPAMSLNLLRRQNGTERHPLKTINRQDFHAGTSEKVGIVEKNEKEKVRNKSNIPLNIDTRYVTVRQKNENLDWDHKVFKDENVKESSIIVISDDEEINVKRKEIRYFVQKRQKNCLGDFNEASTPTLQSPSLEPSRVRNIKQSLKRPHSRELQGLSPIIKQDRGEEKHKRRLEFNERLQNKNSSPDNILGSCMSSLDRDYSSDIFTYLMNTEERANVPKINCQTRSCIINWIIKVNGPTGDASTVQYAQWYFDAVLAVSYVHLDQMQLVAAACYWIAKKIHGPHSYARKLVKCSRYAFTCENLLTAEKTVLKTLNFPRQPVIPQEFISYLSFCCDTLQPKEIEEAATFLYMAGAMVDKHLCEVLPSVQGAAAVRNALLFLRKKDAMLRLMMNSVFIAAEKKTSNISYICSIQRKAVRFISSPCYEYKALLVQYGVPPYNTAQKIITSINKFAAHDIISKTKQNM